MIISDREVFLSNATVIAGGFIFMTLTGLLSTNGSASVFAERLALIVIGTFSASSVLFLFNIDPRLGRGVAIFGYLMLIVFLGNFIFGVRGLI